MKKNLVLFLLLFSLSSTLLAQKRITGTVQDAVSSEALPGVNVVLKGTVKGVITDISGNYSIEVPSDKTILTFSFIGYQSQEIQVGTRSSINILLKTEVTGLDEVVVVGYGTMKKSDLTGAVVSVSEDKLKSTISTNIDQAMQGRVAGVQVTQNSGQPGGATSIRIRGASSVSGSNEPLYVVDGVPFVGEGQSIVGFDWAGGANGQNKVNPLSTINPSDIVSLEVLKDASAAAIYGAQAANGVIIVTTRRGKKGEARVTYDGYMAMQELPVKLDMMNLPEYAVYQNQIADELERTKSSNYLDPSILGKGTDWQDEIFRKAWMKSHQISVTGGNENTVYAISGGYFNQNGIIIGSDFNRLTGRMNMDSQVKKWMKVGGSLAYAETDETITLNDGGDGVIIQALLMQPDVPVYDMDGNFAGPNTVAGASQYNPVALALQRHNTLMRQRTTGNAYLSADFMKGLNFRSEYSFDVSNAVNKAFHPTYEWGVLKNEINKMMQREDHSKFWVWKNYVTYNLKFAEVHSLTMMLGQEMQESSWSGNSLIKQSFTTNDIYVMTEDGTFVSNSGWEDSATQMSYYGRFNYNYADRYLATFTFRGDGSSKFGADNKWGYFPSGSIAWRINNEQFMKNVKAISNMKLRLSYGSVGNMPGSTYLYGSSMTSTKTAFGTGYRLSKFANPSLKWETTEQYNLGLDLGLFDNRVDFRVDVYKKKTRDLLLQISVPSYIGGGTYQDIAAPYANVGKMENKGIDISLSTHNIKSLKFNWTTDMTFSLNRNKVIKLNDENAVYYGKMNWYSEFQTATITKEGLPLGEFYGYVMEGVFKDANDIANHSVQIEDPANPGTNYADKKQGIWIGDVKFRDISGPDGTPDGIINTYDQKVIGDPNPDFTFGINNSFSYGNFDLSVYLSGSYGADILNYTRVQTEGQTSIWNNQGKAVVNRAQTVMIDPEGSTTDAANFQLINPDTNIPRVTSNDNNRNNRMSTRFIEDGSYLRIKNITLGYTFSKNLTQKIGVQRFKVYANIQNVYTFTNYSGYDPEIGAYNQNAMLQNIDMGRYPSPKIYTFGINADF
ncbi:MAG TPA: TonB-dependent receptor [Prolixibacteraceae bacterium]|nr:TonB-dependent receptor [Prolixibacteraceae bacterium]